METHEHDRKYLRRGKFILWFFFTLFLFYALTASGRFSVSDEQKRFALTESIVERASLNVDRIYGAKGVGGKYFVPYAPGVSILGAPFYLVGQLAGRVIGVDASGAFINSFMNCAVTAAAIVVFYLALLRLGLTPAASLLSALLLAIVSPMWPYSRTYFAEPPAALGLVSVLYILSAAPEKWRPAGAAAAGAWATFAFLARYELIVLCPVFLLFILMKYRNRRFLHAAAFCLVPVAGVLVILLYNFLRFGGLLRFGYFDESFSRNIFEGLIGLVASPGKGIVFFFPLSLAAFALWPALARRNPLLTALSVGVPLVTLLTVSKWNLWGGDVSWGPRYLIPVIPFLFLPVAFRIDRLITHRPGRAAHAFVTSLVLLSVLSLGVQVLGISFSFRDLAGYWYTLKTDHDDTRAEHFKFRSSPIKGHLEMLELTLFNRNPGTMNPERNPELNRKLKESLPPDFWIVHKWRENAGAPRRRAVYACLFTALSVLFVFSSFRLYRVIPIRASRVKSK